MEDSTPLPSKIRTLGFWAVLALVTGCQMDSVVFMLPATMAPYGLRFLGGWAVAFLGALALALVFAQLCAWYPKTGGPHVYVEQAFGKTLALFTGWTYWVVSWVSSTAIVVVSASYLAPLLGMTHAYHTIILEVVLMLAVTIVNTLGVKTAGRVGLILSMIRFFPLLVMPLIALFFFNSTHIVTAPSVVHLSMGQTLNQVILLIMWGFVGLESATTTAEAIYNPSKTIPRAVILGTVCVGLLYLLNSIGIMGLIPGAQLMQSTEPYVDAARILFGGSWHRVISLIASMSCIVALNGWMLTSGQAALGLAQDELLPAFFAQKNRFGAPYWGLFVSCIGMLLLLCATAHESLAARIFMIIDFSVVTFLCVYVLCCFAFLKLAMQKQESLGFRFRSIIKGIGALAFCGWVIIGTPVHILLVAGAFVLSGVPWYLYFRSTKTKASVSHGDGRWVPAHALCVHGKPTALKECWACIDKPVGVSKTRVLEK